jgi:hypothetical protein
MMSRLSKDAAKSIGGAFFASSARAAATFLSLSRSRVLRLFVQLAPDVLQINMLPFVGEGRVAVRLALDAAQRQMRQGIIGSQRQRLGSGGFRRREKRQPIIGH